MCRSMKDFLTALPGSSSTCYDDLFFSDTMPRKEKNKVCRVRGRESSGWLPRGNVFVATRGGSVPARESRLCLSSFSLCGHPLLNHCTQHIRVCHTNRAYWSCHRPRSKNKGRSTSTRRSSVKDSVRQCLETAAGSVCIAASAATKRTRAVRNA